MNKYELELEQKLEQKQELEQEIGQELEQKQIIGIWDCLEIKM